MNPRLTRNELLRRGAAGGALLTFPSLFAACGGGDGGGSADGGELKTVLNFANWPFYIDVDKPTSLQKFTEQSKIKVNVETGVIEDARFKTFGCGSAIASSSLATEWLKGRTVDDAAKIKNTDIVNELKLPPVKIHCSVLAEDAIKAALADYKEKWSAAEAGADSGAS